MRKGARAFLIGCAVLSAGIFPIGSTQLANATGDSEPTTILSKETTTQAPSVYTWKMIDNQWYFIDQYGNKKTGWVKDQGKWFYLNQQGVRQSGWLYDGTWYYLNPTDGSMQTNQWVFDHGVWYYVDGNGFMVEDSWVSNSGHWYYLSGNGAMKSSTWFYDNSWYYFASNGRMLTGWQQIGGKWYYFYPSGAMAYNTIVNGYILGKDGVWIPLKDSVLLNAPLISQLPELPKGCEVTSLAMLLNYAGYKVDKMTLAKQIKTVPYRDAQGYYGNPNDGFVGNMYSPLTAEDGYGPNHGPVFDLAKKYLGTKAVDLTGQSFTRVLQKLNEGKPVWVIHTFGFAPVPQSDFDPYRTREGIVMINELEHSVLVTGYDSKYIYFNDPYDNIKNRKADRAKFIAAWQQMGSQAISYH